MLANMKRARGPEVPQGYEDLMTLHWCYLLSISHLTPSPDVN